MTKALRPVYGQPLVSGVSNSTTVAEGGARTTAAGSSPLCGAIPPHLVEDYWVVGAGDEEGQDLRGGATRWAEEWATSPKTTVRRRKC